MLGALGPELQDGADALRTVAAFRLAMPRTVLRFAGGREITLGDLGARQGLLGGINAVIVGNSLTTLGRPAESDIDLLVLAVSFADGGPAQLTTAMRGQTVHLLRTGYKIRT